MLTRPRKEKKVQHDVRDNGKVELAYQACLGGMINDGHVLRIFLDVVMSRLDGKPCICSECAFSSVTGCPGSDAMALPSALSIVNAI